MKNVLLSGFIPTASQSVSTSLMLDSSSNVLLKWVVIAYLVANIVLALIPDLHGQIQSLTADLGDTLRILLRFLFDPTEYVWKWIVGLLVAVIALFSR